MEVIEVNYKKKFIKLKTFLHKIHENDKIAIEGEALVLYKHLEEWIIKIFKMNLIKYLKIRLLHLIVTELFKDIINIFSFELN